MMRLASRVRSIVSTDSVPLDVKLIGFIYVDALSLRSFSSVLWSAFNRFGQRSSPTKGRSASSNCWAIEGSLAIKVVSVDKGAVCCYGLGW
jgi:hypothetical protein